MSKSVLVDLTLCTGCRGCQVACKEWNERKAVKTTLNGNFTNPVKMSADTYTHIRFVEGLKDGSPVWNFVKDQCLHCEHPACASACPVEALTKNVDGAVVYNFDKCIGCRYCMVACPFDIPKYEWDKVLPAVQKCTFCSERIKDNMSPACVATCPSGALLFGERKDNLAEAKSRIKANPKGYVKHIYGEKEAGGTSWMYLSDVPFKDLGFKQKVSNKALPSFTWAQLGTLPGKAAVIATGLTALAVFRNRGNTDDETKTTETEAEVE